MSFNYTNTQIIVAAVLLFLVVAIAVGFYLKYRKTRTLAFKNRFGTEYDRAVETHGSSNKAEARLADRESRVEAMKIRELGATERERFISEWQTVQSRFVDHPKAAVTEADDLINALLIARGYPQSNFEQRAADISVGYPRVMENYRLANGIAVRPGRGDATTEELRTAMIQYRAIFDELVQNANATKQRSAA
jgi:hypothetical protein